MIKYIFFEFMSKEKSVVSINSTDGFSLCFIIYNCLYPSIIDYNYIRFIHFSSVFLITILFFKKIL